MSVRVTVIIPCYNAAAYVARAVQSALAQTHPDMEAIVVDDASSDDPASALAGFGDRVTLIRQRINSGPSAARNEGLRRASGDVVAFLDADDWWPDTFIEQVLPWVDRGTAVCYDNTIVEQASDGSGELLTTDRTLLSAWLKIGPTWIDRRNMNAVLKIPALFKLVAHRDDCLAVGGFDTRYHCGEDMHFCIKLLAGRVKIRVVPEPRGFYLVRGDSILRTIEKSSEKNLSTLRAWWQMFDHLPREQTLSHEAASECRRLSRYYRARYTDASVRAGLRAGGYRELFKPRLLGAVLPATPELLRMKMSGLGRRLFGAATSLRKEAVA